MLQHLYFCTLVVRGAVRTQALDALVYKDIVVLGLSLAQKSAQPCVAGEELACTYLAPHELDIVFDDDRHGMRILILWKPHLHCLSRC